MTFDRLSAHELVLDCLRWKWRAAQPVPEGRDDTSRWAGLVYEVDGFTYREFASRHSRASRAPESGNLRRPNSDTEIVDPELFLVESVLSDSHGFEVENLVALYVETQPPPQIASRLTALLGADAVVLYSFRQSVGGDGLWREFSSQILDLSEMFTVNEDSEAVERYLEIEKWTPAG